MIKVVSWDVYGTLIATRLDEETDCGSEPLRPRNKVLETLEEIKRKGIIQCTCSDGDLKNLRCNLKEAEIPREYFDDLYLMRWQWPKDFSIIIQTYKINPAELLIVGDNYEMDIQPAIEQGCQALWVPEKISPKDIEVGIEKVLEHL
jgi:FMN phosphatase YigB (HAD superfamily)